MFAKGIVPADHPGVTDHVEAFTNQVCEVIVGKSQAVKLAVACLLARGHLLIEDIPDNASLVQRVLISQGYHVAWAETAEAGLSAAEQTPPDLILLDLGLPDIDGQTLVGYLRDIPAIASIPIIAVTAWPEETARMMVSAYGCNGYISKPIDVQAFIKMINSYFSGN